MTRHGTGDPTPDYLLAPAAEPFARLGTPGSSHRCPVRAVLPNGRELLATHGVRQDRTAAPRADGQPAVTGHITVWDVPHRRAICAINTVPSEAVTLATLPDGRAVVAALGSDTMVRCWDALSGHRLTRKPAGQRAGIALAVLPDGRPVVATGIDYAVRVRDAITGDRLFDLATPSQRVPALAAATLSDGQVLLAGASGARVTVWDLPSRAAIRSLAGHRMPVATLALHPLPAGGAVLAAGTGQRVRVWDPIEGVARHTLTCRREPPPSGSGRAELALTTLPDGRCLVAYALVDSADVWLWEARSGAELAGVSTGDGPAWGVSLLGGSAERRAAAVAAIGAGPAVRLWDLAEVAAPPVATGPIDQPASVAALPGRPAALAYLPAPSGRPLLASAHGAGVLLREPGGDVLRTFELDHQVEALGWVTGPDRRALLATAGSGSVRLWDPVDGREVDRYDWQAPPRMAGLALVGQHGEPVLVLVRSLDRIELANARTGQPVATLTTSGRIARSLAAVCRPDGRTAVASGSYDGAVQLWDAGTGTLLRTLVPHLAPVKAVALVVPDDGGLLVLSGDDSGTVRMWDGDGGALLGVRRDVGGPVTALAGHPQPDGGLLVAAAVGGAEHTLLRWSVRPARPVATGGSGPAAGTGASGIAAAAGAGGC